MEEGIAEGLTGGKAPPGGCRHWKPRPLVGAGGPCRLPRATSSLGLVCLFPKALLTAPHPHLSAPHTRTLTHTCEQTA